MARALRRAGYEVHNQSYRSTRYNIKQLTNQYVSPLASRLSQSGPVHFVTHSLGGILVRQYLQDHTLPAGSRIVMLAPPNHGSEVAERIRHWWLFRFLDGPAGQQLGTGKHSVPNQLKQVSADIGVITGNKNTFLLTSHWIPKENDGLVSVESARLDEMKDFLVVHCGHTFIMSHPLVIRQVLYFLKNGCFPGSTNP
jgi:hypothetical protein